MRSLVVLPLSSLLPALLVLTACSDAAGPGGNPNPGALAVAGATPSGDLQSAAVGAALDNPLRVRVTRDGVPEAGITVTWASPDAGASFTPSSATTDADGIGATAWTLGRTAGSQSARADVTGATGAPVSFSATATAGPASRLSALSGDGQSAPVNSPLPQPLRAAVSDAFGNPVAGTAVAWQVTSGSATVSPPSSPTDAFGISSATVTVGAAPGPIVIEASATGLAESPVTFAATGTQSNAATVRLISDGANRFEPDQVTVTVGTTVVWEWQSGFHNVESSLTPDFPGSGPPVSPPMTYSFTFTSPGTYQYHCVVHGTPTSGMRGIIVVQ